MLVNKPPARANMSHSGAKNKRLQRPSLIQLSHRRGPWSKKHIIIANAAATERAKVKIHQDGVCTDVQDAVAYPWRDKATAFRMLVIGS